MAVACAVLSAVNDRRQSAEDSGRYSPLETKDGLFPRSQIGIQCVIAGDGSDRWNRDRIRLSSE